MGSYPVDRMLSPEQWRILVERVGRDAERTGDLTHVRSLLDRLVMFRGSLEPAQTPDLTPLLLAVIDGAARGDSTLLLHASKVHAWSDANSGILNRELIRARLMTRCNASRHRSRPSRWRCWLQVWDRKTLCGRHACSNGSVRGRRGTAPSRARMVGELLPLADGAAIGRVQIRFSPCEATGSAQKFGAR